MGNVEVNYRIIGLNLSRIRLERSLTQERLAENAGLSKQFVCNLECGRAIPSLSTVLSLCNALSVTPNDLLHYTYDSEPDSPNALRDDHSIFTQTITDYLFPPKNHTVCIDLQDLPAFDITLPDLDAES